MSQQIWHIGVAVDDLERGKKALLTYVWVRLVCGFTVTGVFLRLRLWSGGLAGGAVRWCAVCCTGGRRWGWTRPCVGPSRCAHVWAGGCLPRVVGA
jgi:hypothetical protein